jgi:hypothetical protein
MFGILGDIVDEAINTASDFVEDPIRKTVQVATQPIRDGLEVVDGLTEGELRIKAAARLGVDVVSGDGSW